MYCDFPVMAIGQNTFKSMASPEINNHYLKIQSDYIEYLVREIEFTRKIIAGATRPRIETVYIGGGTPSTLSAENFLKLSTALGQNFDLGDIQEFTIEVEPDSITTDKLDLYTANHINRVSMGIQSFNQRTLELLGRSSSLSHIENALEILARHPKFYQNRKFTNITFDLLLGNPNESFADFQNSVTRLIALSPTHLSAYFLTIEKGTPFHKKYSEYKAPMPPEELIFSKAIWLENILQENGFLQYQISSFSLSKKHESQHNRMYWRSDVDYWAFGMGASSLVGGYRFKRPATIKKYSIWVDGLTGVSGEKFLRLGDRENGSLAVAFETLFIGKFTTVEGVTREEVKRKFEDYDENDSFEQFWDGLVGKLGGYEERGLVSFDVKPDYYLKGFGGGGGRGTVRCKGMEGFMLSNFLTLQILEFFDAFFEGDGR